MAGMDILNIIVCISVLTFAPIANSQEFGDIFGGASPFGVGGFFSSSSPVVPVGPAPTQSPSGFGGSFDFANTFPTPTQSPNGFGGSFDFANVFQPLEFGSSIDSPTDSKPGQETIQDKFVRSELTGIDTLNQFLPSLPSPPGYGSSPKDKGGDFGDAFDSIRDSFSPSGGFGFDLSMFGN
eukprot:TRINITY_DN72_c0_g1_i4.p2 TRINITY_DN72_c0_g1~~TRINITY_DN72_c0_g1_i4.p2  ORF type:complete len:181 (+),score=22.97 TRINITY_DN72_c0_g1_i4:177-719(+)